MPDEPLVRAAMVLNLLRFTGFPPDEHNAQIRICTQVEDARQEAALAGLGGRMLGGRAIKVRQVTRPTDACDVFYTDGRPPRNIPQNQAMLTIGSQPGFAARGGMIEIDVDANGSRFDINLAESKRARFHFAPQLLGLARKVYD